MKNSDTPKRQSRAIETKAKIYTAADQLFREKGFKNVTVDAIVEKAGVAKGSFYVHFESKNAFITSRIEEIVDDLDKSYRSFFESLSPDTSSSEIFLSVTGKIAEVLDETIGHDLMKIAYETMLTKEINSSPLIGYSRELYKMFNELIERGIQQGEFRPEKSVDTIAKHCILSMRGIVYEWCIRYPDFNLKDEFLTHFELLLNGITNHSREVRTDIK